MTFSTTIALRWSDFDINHHLRHITYAECATQARIQLLHELDLDLHQLLSKYGVTPILLEEKCQYLQEIPLQENWLRVDTKIIEISQDYRKYRFLQTLLNSRQDTCAIITILGAWLDARKRKIVPAPDSVIAAFEKNQTLADQTTSD